MFVKKKFAKLKVVSEVLLFQDVTCQHSLLPDKKEFVKIRITPKTRERKGPP
jgi:hypothetical protein